MIIVVNHKINNLTKFWDSIGINLPLLPEAGVNRIIQMLPNIEMTEITCVWEAQAIAALDFYLRSKVFDWSTETYYELNLSHNIGFS